MKAYDSVGKAHYTDQTRNMLKCACLAGMGTSSNPVVVETLVRVLRQPRASKKDPSEDQQRQMDEMIAAARALGHFKQYQGTEALVEVLRSDRDVALRKDPYFDWSQALLQIAIVLASVHLIIGNLWLLGLSGGLGALGVLLMLNGFTLAVTLPFLG